MAVDHHVHAIVVQEAPDAPHDRIAARARPRREERVMPVRRQKDEHAHALSDVHVEDAIMLPIVLIGRRQTTKVAGFRVPALALVL